ncbi:MAG: BatA domain-containing protein [bacterium]
MTFVKWTMLAGLVAVAIPIIIHLLNRRRAQTVDWGAMQFLLASLARRNRRLMIEEMLLLALRCLLLALLVLAMARPFVPAGSRVPWAVVLPTALLAAAAFGAGTALWRRHGWRWLLYAVSFVLVALAAVAVVGERWLQLRRWTGGGSNQDVAIVIDGSVSMRLGLGDRTNFERAVDEAHAVVDALHPGDAASIILAGSVPQIKTPAPLVDREDLARRLDALAPTGGSMAVVDALNAAGLTLAEGQNPAKKIVFITDRQRVGWDAANESRWEFLADTLGELPTRPRVLCRRLPLPERVRNAAIARVEIDQKIIGPDRKVPVKVAVENTGHEAVSRCRVHLEIDGQPVGSRTLRQLRPGSAETARFAHQFQAGGLHVVRARLGLDDHLPADSTAVRVGRSVERLPVLIVDGNPGPRFLDRSSSYIKTALAPSPDRPAERGRLGTLVQVDVVDAPNVSAVDDFARYSVVVLANVPRLPEKAKGSRERSAAERLAAFVARGGGLLIAAGDRADPTFYARWTTEQKLPVTPARLAKRNVVGRDEQAARPAAKTFDHKALELVAHGTDIDKARLAAYWTLEAERTDASVAFCGMLDNGDPFAVERHLGQGRVLLCAVPLDASDSNLPGLKSFVPLVHEMVYYLIQPGRTQWNFAPAAELSVPLVQGVTAAAASEHGLRGDYYLGKEFTRHKLTRTDPRVNFRWSGRGRADVGKDAASIRWTGSVVAPYTEPFEFTVHTNGLAALWIDDSLVIEKREQRGREYAASGTADLQAGRRHDVRLEFHPRKSPPAINLYWQSPSQSRELVPRRCLWPRRPMGKDLATAGQVEVIRPGGTRSEAPVAAPDDRSALVCVKNVAEPGLYRIRPSEGLKERFFDMLDGEGTIPFAVTADVRESRLVELSPAELNQTAHHVDLFQPDSVEQLVAAVGGGIPGKELWKYLAVAVLVALLAEIALTRWIARQRRTGDVRAVRFDSGAVDPVDYRRRAREMLEIGN